MNESKDIVEAADEIAYAIRDLADAVREIPVPPEHDKVASAISDLADAVRESAPSGSDYNEVAGAISELAHAVRNRGE